MLSRQRYWHALPDAWQHMDYQAFLAARRKLMGQVVRDAYAKLNEHGYRPSTRSRTGVRRPRTRYHATWTHHGVHLADLISADLLPGWHDAAPGAARHRRSRHRAARREDRLR